MAFGTTAWHPDSLEGQQRQTSCSEVTKACLTLLPTYIQSSWAHRRLSSNLCRPLER